MAHPHTTETINWWFAEWHRTHPIFCRYSSCPTPFNANSYFTIIANCLRPLTESKSYLARVRTMARGTPQSGQRQKDRSGYKYKAAVTTNLGLEYSPGLKPSSNCGHTGSRSKNCPGLFGEETGLTSTSPAVPGPTPAWRSCGVQLAKTINFY